MLDVAAALETVCNWMSMFRLMTLRVAEASASRSASRRPDMALEWISESSTNSQKGVIYGNYEM
jgi:hypothetical protein